MVTIILGKAERDVLLDLQWTHLMHIISLINLSYYSIISLDILILSQTLSYSALRHHACAVWFILRQDTNYSVSKAVWF